MKTDKDKPTPPFTSPTEQEKYFAHQNNKIDTRKRRRAVFKRGLKLFLLNFVKGVATLGAIALCLFMLFTVFSSLVKSYDGYQDQKQAVVKLQEKVKDMDQDYAVALKDAYLLDERQINDASNSLQFSFRVQIRVASNQICKDMRWELIDATNQLVTSPDRLKPWPVKTNVDFGPTNGMFLLGVTNTTVYSNMIITNLSIRSRFHSY